MLVVRKDAPRLVLQDRAGFFFVRSYIFPRMTALRVACIYIRSRSGTDAALVTLAAAVVIWLLSRLVLLYGSRGSLLGVIVVTVEALVVMGIWCAAAWIWLGRNRSS